MLLLAVVVLGIWLYLTFAHGGYWRTSQHTASGGVPHDPVKIVAIVPARDEADVIGQSLTALLAQELVVPIHIVLVDDDSSDGTTLTAIEVAHAINAIDRLTVISGQPLPIGWTGKLWALQQGIGASMQFNPDYLLFTDADIFHGPKSIAALIASAQREGRDLASYMVLLATESWAERLLIPAFVYFFFQLYPPAFIKDVRRKTAGAAGGCVLIRPQALLKAGGIAAIRSEVIDDCALARIVKQSGGKLSLQPTRDSRSIRSYGSFGGVGSMIARSAFFQLRHSYLLLAGTLAGLVLVYCAPPALLLADGWPTKFCGALAWILMSATFYPIVRFYRQPWFVSLLLPLIAIFYAGATLYSAILYMTGHGGRWKGRVQDAAPK